MKRMKLRRFLYLALSLLLVLTQVCVPAAAENEAAAGAEEQVNEGQSVPEASGTEPVATDTEPDADETAEPAGPTAAPEEQEEGKEVPEEPGSADSPAEEAVEADAAVTLAAEEKYPRDENGKFLVVENYVDKIDLVPDTKLFGVYENGKWRTEPLIDYDYSPDLEPVRQAVMKGDIDGAKIELLEYYRLVKSRRPVQARPTLTEEQLTLGRLLDYNVLRNSNSAIKYLNTFEVGATEKEITVDLKSRISNVLATPVIKLVSVRRDGSRIQFRDRTAGNAAPRIEMIINGAQRVFYPVEDGTVRAGSLKSKSFPDEHYLYAQESQTAIKTITTDDKVIEDWHNPSPFDENTERTLLKFDLSGVDASQNITSMTFHITAQALNTEENKEILMLALGDSAWTEKNLCWNSYEHLFACYDGEPYVRFHQPWQDKYSNRYRDELQRLKGYLDYAADAYRMLENEEMREAYARRCLTQMCGFFDQLGNVPTMAYTSWATNSYQTASYGRNKLDVGSRANNLSPMMFNLINSTYMTPEIWTSYVKYSYRTMDYLQKKENWNSENNWGTIQTSGLYTTTMNLREFKRSKEFLDTVIERTYNGRLMGSDLASNEVPVSYASTNLSSLFNLQNVANGIGETAPYTPEAYNQLVGLAKYITFASGPGFVSIAQGDGSQPGSSMTQGVVKDVANFTKDPILLWGASNGKQGTGPVFTSHRYTSNQHYIMRTGWHENDLFMQTNMDGGFESHGHMDDLGVIAFAYGKYLLVDPGYDSYDGTKESTIWLRSTKAHNTVEVNGKSQNFPKSKSGLGKSNEWQTNDSYDYFNGTVSTNSTASHTRNILFIKDGYWIVTDYLQPKNSNSNRYIQTWHMLPDAGIDMNSASKQVKTNFEDVNLTVAPVDEEEYSRSEIKTGYYGGGTAALWNADYVEYEKVGSGNTRFSTVLVPENLGEDLDVQTDKIELPDVKNEGAAAMQINISGEKDRSATYYTVNDFSQAAARVVGNYETNGTMMYVENRDGKLSKIYAQDVNKKAAGLYIKDMETGQILLESTRPLSGVAVEQSGSLIKLYTNNNANQVTNTITYTDLDLSALKIYAPQYTDTVLVNGKAEKFYKQNGYLYFGSGVTDEGKPSEPGNTGSGHGGSGGNTGGGGGGNTGEPGGSKPGPAVTDKPAQPQPGTEAYKTLLKQSVEGHWAQEEISALIDAGIVEGDNGVLHLEQTVTRAEFTAMVARAVGLTAAEYQGGFADIDGGAWYAGIVQAAFDKGVIQGDGASFRPDDPITREEMAVIAAKLAQTSGVSGNDTGGAFADEDQISGWSREYVKEAAELGLIQGFEDGSFQPGGDALREQAMVIVYRLRGILPETE